MRRRMWRRCGGEGDGDGKQGESENENKNENENEEGGGGAGAQAGRSVGGGATARLVHRGHECVPEPGDTG